MGYYITLTGIHCFEPDNTEDTLYINSSGGLDFADIIERIESHFKIPFHPSDFLITAERIHTYCIYYDMYDSSDHTNYIVIQLKGNLNEI